MSRVTSRMHNEMQRASIVARDAAEFATAQLRAENAELVRVLRELVDALWDGRAEAEGLEHYTDPARAAIAIADRRERALKRREGKNE